MEAATTGAPAAAEGEAQVQGEEAQAEATPEQQAAEWQAGVDARLGDALDGIRQVASNFESLQSRIPEPQAEPEVDFQEQFNELFQESGGFPDPAQMQGLIQQQIQAGIKEAVAPLQEQFNTVNQKMTAQELGALQTKFPELADAKTADGLASEVVTRAEQWGVPQLANSAEFVEMVHRDMKSRQTAQQETPAGQGSVPQLETGGGAAPASSGGDEWESFVSKTGGSGRVW